MTRESMQAWLDRYVEAWRTYDAQKIAGLFSEDALYFFSPFEAEAPVRGREAIVSNWLKERDDPSLWEAHYTPIAVEGNVCVANGRTRYLRRDGALEREYDNIFVLHFDDAGRCDRFREWYMKAPER